MAGYYNPQQNKLDFHSREYDSQSKLEDTSSGKSDHFWLSVRYRISGESDIRSMSLPATETGLSRLSEMSEDRRYSALYVGQALFRNGRGIARNLGAFTHVWCDLDCYGSDPETVMSEVVGKCLSEGIPLPSTFTSSGRGIYLKWLFLDPVFVKKGQSSQRLIIALNKRMVEVFREFSADSNATDATRILRVPGSVNHKSGTVCHVMHDTGERYSVSDLKAAFLPFSDEEMASFYVEKRRKKRERKARIISLQAERLARRPKTSGRANFSAKSHAHCIIDDLRKLAEIRWGGEVREGFRDMFGHIGISALSTCTDAENLLRDAITFMGDFLPSDYIETEFEGHSRSAIELVRKGQSYRYRTARMVELLDITTEEMKSLSVLVSDAQRLDKKRRNDAASKAEKRRKSGAATRSEYLESVRSQEPKVWNILGISRAAYYRKKAHWDAEILRRHEEAEAKKRHVSDARVMASELAFRGIIDDGELGRRNYRRKDLVAKFEAMDIEAFYALHTPQKIATLRKKRADYQREYRARKANVFDLSSGVSKAIMQGTG